MLFSKKKSFSVDECFMKNFCFEKVVCDRIKKNGRLWQPLIQCRMWVHDAYTEIDGK